MKTMKWIILATLLISGSTLMAQTTRTNKLADQAFYQTSRLFSSLNLSNEQIVKIMDINEKYINLEANNATNTQLSAKKAKKAQKKLAAAKEKEINSVLKENKNNVGQAANSDVLESADTPSVAIISASQTIYFGSDTQSLNVQ